MINFADGGIDKNKKQNKLKILCTLVFVTFIFALNLFVYLGLQGIRDQNILLKESFENSIKENVYKLEKMNFDFFFDASVRVLSCESDGKKIILSVMGDKFTDILSFQKRLGETFIIEEINKNEEGLLVSKLAGGVIELE